MKVSVHAAKLRTLLLHYLFCKLFYDSNCCVILLVIGCPDTSPPPYSHVSMTGDVALITCDSGEDSWELACMGTSWDGGEDAVNCPAGRSIL